MQVGLKTALITAGSFLLFLLLVVGFFTLKARAYEQQIVDLQNAVASRDQTIETQKGVYERLAIQSQDLTELMNGKDREVQALRESLRKAGAELLSVNTIVVKLKKDLESHHTGVVTIPNPEKPGMKTVDIDTKDQMDPFQVTGKVLIDCTGNEAIVDVKLRQCRPLNISVVVSQGEDGSWKTSSTSSIENFGVDITLAAVNPYVLEPRWYEKIGASVDVGVSGNPGLLVGAGLDSQIGKFEVGPKAWVVVDKGVSSYFGAQLLWHPFQR